MEKKKMGRPLKSAEPKNISLHLRITESEAERIKKCSEALCLNRTETIMHGIECIEERIESI